MPPLTLGRIIAFLVFVLAAVFAAVGSMPLVVAGMFIGLALAIIVP